MSTRRTVIIAGAAAAVLALPAGWYFGAVRRDAESVTRASAASLLALSLPDAAGNEQPLAQWRGKLLIVNFWATWCEPCREEMPEFVRAQREFGAKGLQFVGIAVDDADKVRRFTGEIALNYPALIGGYGAMELSKTLGNRYMALPFTVIVGRDGAIVHTQLGPLKSDQMRKIIGKFI
jgi:thiol-disulfide isomerase/thioredoxin